MRPTRRDKDAMFWRRCQQEGLSYQTTREFKEEVKREKKKTGTRRNRKKKKPVATKGNTSSEDCPFDPSRFGFTITGESQRQEST